MQARDEVVAAIERVYARPEFSERTLPGLLQAIVDAWAAIRHWLVFLLVRSIELVGWSSFLSRLLVLLFAVVAGAALLYLARLAVLAWRRREAGLTPDGSPTAGSDVAPLDAAAWEAAARTAAAAGRLREASLALYRAVLLRLQERGVLRVHDGKTPGDYRREARAHPDVAPDVDRFLRLFLPLAFGRATPAISAFAALDSAAAPLGARVQPPESAHA